MSPRNHTKVSLHFEPFVSSKYLGGHPINRDLMRGDILCLAIHKLFPDDLKLRQITKNAHLNYDRRKNFKLLHKVCYRHEIGKSIDIENIVECNNVVQLVELVKQIHTFFVDNIFALQQNAENNRAKREAAQEKLNIIE